MAIDLSEALHARILYHLSRLDAYTMKKGRAKDEIVAAFAEDPLYSIFGLDTPEYVGAILAGGTVTSVHRKIGDLYEDCVQTIIRTTLGLDPKMTRLAAKITSGTVEETRTTDQHIPFEVLLGGHGDRLRRLAEHEILAITNAPQINVIGIGFEVRHCYQSADSKRIQADEAMARFLLVSGYLPMMLIFCNQSNKDIIRRYTGTWIVKEGHAAYRALAEISGFDFYEFLLANRDTYREVVQRALRRIQV